MTLPTTLPKLIAFDLDATLWIPEMYELYGPPFKLDKKDPNYLVDGSGERISLMGASRQILKELATDEKWRETTVAYVSRTEHPKWAATCLNLFRITEGILMNDIGLEQEIYPGSKTRHFRKLQERTGIDYSEMLFFDNESWNITDVAPMGVLSVHTPRGMTAEVWKQGLKAFGAASEARERGETPKLAIRSSKRGGFDCFQSEMTSLTATAFKGAKVQTRAQTRTRATRVIISAQMHESVRRQAFGAAAAAVLLAAAPAAHADLTADLLAKSAANAELHNKQRLAASYSNFARSRTVADGTCQFPGNVLGCDVGGYAGDVKYIADDIKIQCEGKEAGKCASKVSIPRGN